MTGLGSIGTMASGAGGRVESDIGNLVPEVHAAWLYDIVTDTQEITSTYTGAGGAFKTNGVDLARHGANLGASVALRTISNITLSANYDAEFREEYSSHSGMLTINYSF